MLTAVDTSLLDDVVGADAALGERSADALRACATEGLIRRVRDRLGRGRERVPGTDAAANALATLGIVYGARMRRVPLGVLTDGCCLLTRDRGFYRAYFKELEILGPTT